MIDRPCALAELAAGPYRWAAGTKSSCTSPFDRSTDAERFPAPLHTNPFCTNFCLRRRLGKCALVRLARRDRPDKPSTLSTTTRLRPS